MTGPTLEISKQIHAEKYRHDGETFPEAMTRIANFLADDLAHFRAFRDILMDMRFLPAGRVQAGAGSPRKVTLFNCFVSSTIEDSFESIMEAAKEAGQTMRMGGGIGYDFSRLRPKGDRIVSLGSRSSGPVSFMGIYDAICKTIASAGHRRGAQMGVLRIDHPDVMDFIRSKQNDNALTAFNVSLGVTDDFMKALKAGDAFELKFDGRTYDRVDANALWDEIMRSTWDWAEPGVVFIDQMNRMNNLWYCETIAATNPCSEQPLPPNGSCLLGSFNLVKYVMSGRFDFAQFLADIKHVVRAMDLVTDKSIYPLDKQEVEAKSKRRMGLGVTGLANALEFLGLSYGCLEFIKFEEQILSCLKNECYRVSTQLAKEKGAFPLFNKEKYLQGEFIKTLDEDVQKDIGLYGIRNSHLTSIAPTGTISLTADNTSSGVEPPFALSYERTIQQFTGPVVETVTDWGFRQGISGKTATQVTADEHLNVLIAASRHVDSAVSKTCNIDPLMPWDDFKDIYIRAYEGGCKGVTTFNPRGKRYGILNAAPQSEENEQGMACYVDLETGKKTCE